MESSIYSDILTIALSFTASALLPALLYSRCRWRSRGGWWVLGLLWVALCIGSTANILMFTSGEGTLTRPMLFNPDARRWYYYAFRFVNGIDVPLVYIAPALPYALAMKLFGQNVAVCIAVNMSAMLATVVFVGSMAATWTGRKGAILAMAMTSLVAYLFASATLPLKEPLTVLAMAMAAMPLARPGDRRPRTILIFAAGCLLMMLTRTQYLLFIAVGIILCLWRRKSDIPHVALLLAIIGLSLLIFYLSFSEMQYRLDASTYSGEKYANEIVETDASHAAYGGFATRYHTLAWPLRLLLLPVTAGVQFMIPLPWTALDHIRYGYTMVYAHMGFAWYAIGGLTLYYIIFCMKNGPRRLSVFIAWGFASWLSTAYITGGTVSRYGLPILPMFVVAASWVWTNCRDRRSFKIYSVAFTALILLALGAAFYLQHS